jgi:hypothetical protein
MPWILVTHTTFGVRESVPVNTDLVEYARKRIEGDPGAGANAPTILHLADGSELPIQESSAWFYEQVKNEGQTGS